jgi:hypothetical protein
MLQLCGNVSPAVNKMLSGTTTEHWLIAASVVAPTWVNSEFGSNEMEASGLQAKKHMEQRI